MDGRIVTTLVAKDLSLLFKNRFFALITVFGLVFYVATYFLIPQTVDETLDLALYAPAVPAALAALESEGLALHRMESEETLKAAVAGGDYQAGVVLPDGLSDHIAAGDKIQVHLYFSTDLPDEFQQLYIIFLQELAFMIAGQPLNIETTEEVLGPDLAGMQIPPRDRLLPLLAIFILMMETLGLASLISMEIAAGTLQALLVTPMRVQHLFLGKGLTGTFLAFGQVVLLMAITGGLSRQPGLILLALLLGSILVTGIGFLVASVARDMMSVMGWGVVALLVLAIPAVTILLPGTASAWVRVLPSYYLIDTVHQVLNFGAGWGQVWPNLLGLTAFSALFVALGILVLQRKFT
jgi:ABC-2 type transport system permease protein